MKIILQLSLFAALWNHVELWGLDCVKFENLDLHIPENPVAAGVGKNKDTWYTHIHWYDLPAGDLTLSYKLERWHDGLNSWRPYTTEPVEIFTEGSSEHHDIAKFVRKALGLTLRHTEIPGKVRVPSTLFTDGKCWPVHFKHYYEIYIKFRIILDVVDEEGNQILTGTIIIPNKE